MIELAHCPEFALGSAMVRPSSREIVAAGEATMVEPKVMQMLVALADPVGRVVPREEIVDRRWSGRIVGEDAINRVLGKLRKAAEGRGFRIETVARVGYRIVVIAAEPAAAKSSPGGRHRLWATGAFLAAVTVATWLATTQPWRPAVPAGSSPKVMAGVLPAAVHDLETRGLAAMFKNTAEQTSEATGYLKQATAAAPGSAGVWGSLAMSYVLALGWVAPGERAGVVARVEDAARHGLAIDPHEPRSLAALASLVPSYHNWSAKAAALAEARRQAPSDRGPLQYQEVQFLAAVGHTREALVKVHRNDRIDAGHIRHLQIHEHDVRCKPCKFSNRLSAAGGFANDTDIGLGADNGTYALAHEQMIIHKQDRYSRSLISASFSVCYPRIHPACRLC